MWQKKQTTLTKIGAIFILVYALIIQNPETGLDFSGFESKSELKLSSVENDLSSDDIFSYEKGKLKLAVENKIQKPESKREAPQVASISREKPTSTPIPTSSPTLTPTPTVQPEATQQVPTNIPSENVDIVEKIQIYANEYKVDANIMVAIATCESGLRTDAVNGQYAGIFQFHPSTWQSNRRAMGLDDSTSLRFDPDEAAKTAAFKMSRDGFGAWPECSRKALLAEK